MYNNNNNNDNNDNKNSNTRDPLQQFEQEQVQHASSYDSPAQTSSAHEYHPEEGVPVQVKQSGPGIASFIIGLISIIGGIASLAVLVSAFAELIDDPEATQNLTQQDIEAMFSGEELTILLGLLFFLGTIALSFIGVILGIIGVVMKNRRKTFGIIGLVLNGLIIGGLLLLIIIGVLTGGAV